MDYDDGWIVEMVLWRVPSPVPPSKHGVKDSLFYGRPGVREVGYDNERGKGDHRHFQGEVRWDRHDSSIIDTKCPVRHRGGRVSMAVTRSSSAFSRSLRSLSDTSRRCIRAKLPRANRSRPRRISVCMSRMDSCN